MELADRPLDRGALIAAARQLDLWADDTLREEIDGFQMAEKVVTAYLLAVPRVQEGEDG